MGMISIVSIIVKEPFHREATSSVFTEVSEFCINPCIEISSYVTVFPLQGIFLDEIISELKTLDKLPTHGPFSNHGPKSAVTVMVES